MHLILPTDRIPQYVYAKTKQSFSVLTWHHFFTYKYARKFWNQMQK